MNDRFTFRVWYKQGKKFFDGIYPGYMALPNTSNEEAFVLEQCTGLKDKNGRLIYEGDIIAVANGSVNGNVLISKWQVVWKEKEGRYSLPSWVGDEPDFSHYVEVLGNIHENPELLEDK